MSVDSPVLTHVAPTLSRAMHGPLSDMVKRSLYSSLAIDPDEANAKTKLREELSNPDNLLVLRELEGSFKAEMQQLGIDPSALSAPAKTSVKPQLLISAIFLTAYFILLATIIAIEVSDTLNMAVGENSLMGQIQILFGVLTAGVGQILSYWFSNNAKKSDDNTPA
uniref:hypothetical protein n=1 Tax=Thaumasiovibrio occultus TaxID=1891184 RepID=UPI000B352DEA|nr:hypothetical protein [Thaumasiovibrio occultus]